MRSRVLPPLDLLVPFEAAARLGSFTRAANELNVTQSAISQRVRALEDHLGVALFERTHRRIALTSPGRELLNGATVALGHLEAATQSVRRTERQTRIRIATDTSIASLWLMPRLTQFHAEHPDIAVDLTASDREDECLGAEVLILHGDGTWPGFESALLFGDSIYPVCSPEYLDRSGIGDMADLLTADLIDLDYQHWNWMNWGIWLTERNLDPAKVRRVYQSNSYPMVLQAARAGWGVALGWAPCVDDDIARARLTRIGEDDVTTRYGYYLASREDAGPEATTFVHWLRGRT